MARPKIRYSLRSFFLIATLLGIALVAFISFLMRPSRIEEASQSRKYDDLSWYENPEDGRHAALYLAWLCERPGLTNSWFQEEAPDSILRLKKREMTPLEFLEECDGVLMSDFMSEEGMLFSDFYYQGAFLKDFNATDTSGRTGWELYHDLKPLLDQRLEEWEAANEPNAVP